LPNPNFNFQRCIHSALVARSWTEIRLAKETGISRAVVSQHVSGKRPISYNDLLRYLKVLNSQERPKLLWAWLSDHLPAELQEDLFSASGEDLAQAVTEFVPGLDAEHQALFSWWAREVSRDGELDDLLKLLSAKAGYRGKVAGPVKRRRRGGGLVALLVLALLLRGLGPPQFPHARQGGAPALALGGRERFTLPAAEAA
jgi:transcriptional regulator with XRE-family HTH domain